MDFALQMVALLVIAVVFGFIASLVTAMCDRLFGRHVMKRVRSPLGDLMVFDCGTILLRDNRGDLRCLAAPGAELPPTISDELPHHEV